MDGYFILDGTDVVEARTWAEWTRWWFSAQPPAQRTEVRGLVIETVFTGHDHRPERQGPPEVFETRLSGEPVGRYASWESARAGHERAVNRVSVSWRRP